MPDTVGNSFSNATSLQVNPGKFQFDRAEQVGSSDPLDIYKFTLAGKSSFSAAAVDLTGDVSLTLFSGTTAIATSNTNSAKGSESLSLDLNPGTYYLQISPNNSTTSDYRLLFETRSSPKTNVIWRNTSNGINAAWQLNTAGTIVGVENYLTLNDSSWTIADVSDFNGDGESDLLWRQASTGRNAIWEIRNGSISNSYYLQSRDSSWRINLATDLNSDGKGDILWQNNLGQNVVWYMDGGTILNSESLLTVSDLNWSLEAAGDFNYDGKTDLLWRNYNTGENSAWLMNGSQISGVMNFLTVNDRSWSIQGAGDFNDDGKVDLLWRHTSGIIASWNLNGATIASSTELISVADSSWQIMGVGKRFETPTAADLPGSNSLQPLNLGDITGLTAGGSVRVKGSVDGNSDPIDFYRFTLTSTTVVDITLDNAIASLQLTTANGTQIQQGNGSQTLQAGTYYLKATTQSAKADYFLQLTARTPDPNVIKYSFTYSYDPGKTTADTYSGWVYADEGKYAINSWVDVNTNNTDAGTNGKYLITGSSLHGTRIAVGNDRGKVFVNSYSDNDRSDPTSYTISSLSAIGNSYLGSEFGITGSGTDFDFGYDAYEFDHKSDIVATNLNVTQTQSTPGGTITVSWQLRNLANQSTQRGFKGSLYLSKDNVITTGDYLIATGDFATLAGQGTSQVYSGTYTLPSDSNPLWSNSGTYYVGFIADVENAIAESYETNNANRGQGIDIDSIAITLPPKVIKYNFTYFYNGVDSKADFYSGWVYGNEGTYIVNGWYDPNTAANETGVNGKYLITSSSVHGTQSVVGADRGKVFVSSYTDADRSDPTAYQPNSAKNNVAAGTNYLGSEVSDFNSGGANFDFGNDAWEFDAKPDLVAVSFDIVQTQAATGSAVNINWQVRNIGAQDATAGFTADIYLSKDSTISTSDYFLGSYSIGIASAGVATALTATTYNLPGLTDAFWNGGYGTYYIGIISDTSNAINEAYETNNANRGQGTDWDSFTLVTPSIAVTTPNGGENLRPGSSINITWNDNIAENVRIELFKGNSFVQTIAQSVASTGSYSWTLPTNLLKGNDYTIKITSVNNNSISDVSNQSFSIGSTFNIQFDYRFDTTNWYTTARRTALEAAADFWEGIILDEFADTPIGTLVPNVENPSTGQMIGVNRIFTTDVAIDDLLVFVGTRDIPGDTLAQAGPSGYYTNDVRYAGEDFEPRIGSLTFDHTINWFIDSTPATRNDIPTNQFDFIGTAIHELGHILGFSRGLYAFDRHVVNNTFTGPNAMAVNGGRPIPLHHDSHIQENYEHSNYGENSLDPTTTTGVRQLPTMLDIAILDDIGYTVNYAMASNN